MANYLLLRFIIIVMKIEKISQQTFKGFTPYSATELLDRNVLLNKALFDVTGSDAPWVIMANNKEERRERLNRALLSFGLIFVSPLIVLPFANRFAMKNMTKLTSKLFSNEYNAIRLSNKHLLNKEETQKGLKELSEKMKIDFNPMIERTGGDYEKIRKKIITAKNEVLACDFFLIAGTFGNIGFFNNWQTKKKTGQKGYSAEMEMANKEIVEKRAEKYEKSRNIKFGTFLAILATTIIGVPLTIKHGLSSTKNSKINNFVKKYAEKFDYTDAIFMKRLPLAIGLATAHLGINLASRNKTETKDNAIRSSTSFAIFFGGDLLFASLLGKLSDKLLKTKLIKHKKNETLLTKILPPVHSLSEQKSLGCKKSLYTSIALFWVNFITMSALMGFVTPYLINKIIKKDVSSDVAKSKQK